MAVAITCWYADKSAKTMSFCLTASQLQLLSGMDIESRSSKLNSLLTLLLFGNQFSWTLFDIEWHSFRINWSMVRSVCSHLTYFHWTDNHEYYFIREKSSTSKACQDWLMIFDSGRNKQPLKTPFTSSSVEVPKPVGTCKLYVCVYWTFIDCHQSK